MPYLYSTEVRVAYRVLVCACSDLLIQYGKPDNASRPGGPLQQIVISSNISTFHIIADNTTVSYLHSTIPSSCNDTATFQLSVPQAYNASQTSNVQPGQAIQYYRSSSVVLTLDGYNNTAAFGSDESAPPTPLPSNIDTDLMTCINQTIGDSVPLVGSGAQAYGYSSSLIFLLFWVIWFCNTL